MADHHHVCGIGGVSVSALLHLVLLHQKEEMSIPEFISLAILSDCEAKDTDKLTKKFKDYVDDSAHLWPALSMLISTKLITTYKREEKNKPDVLIYTITPDGIVEYEKQREKLQAALREL